METQDEQFFSPKEQIEIRKNLAEGNRLAMEEQAKRGHKPHPRIEQWKNPKK